MPLIVKHRDCRTTWQINIDKKSDAPAAALETVLAWRFAAGPAKANSPVEPARRELDPAGWSAEWHAADGTVVPVEIPPIPPAPPAE